MRRRTTGNKNCAKPQQLQPCFFHIVRLPPVSGKGTFVFHWCTCMRLHLLSASSLHGRQKLKRHRHQLPFQIKCVIFASSYREAQEQHITWVSSESAEANAPQARALMVDLSTTNFSVGFIDRVRNRARWDFVTPPENITDLNVTVSFATLHQDLFLIELTAYISRQIFYRFDRGKKYVYDFLNGTCVSAALNFSSILLPDITNVTYQGKCYTLSLPVSPLNPSRNSRLFHTLHGTTTLLWVVFTAYSLFLQERERNYRGFHANPGAGKIHSMALLFTRIEQLIVLLRYFFQVRVSPSLCLSSILWRLSLLP